MSQRSPTDTAHTTSTNAREILLLIRDEQQRVLRERIIYKERILLEKERRRRENEANVQKSHIEATSHQKDSMKKEINEKDDSADTMMENGTSEAQGLHHDSDTRAAVEERMSYIISRKAELHSPSHSNHATNASTSGSGPFGNSNTSQSNRNTPSRIPGRNMEERVRLRAQRVSRSNETTMTSTSYPDTDPTIADLESSLVEEQERHKNLQNRLSRLEKKCTSQESTVTSISNSSPVVNSRRVDVVSVPVVTKQQEYEYNMLSEQEKIEETERFQNIKNDYCYHDKSSNDGGQCQKCLQLTEEEKTEIEKDVTRRLALSTVAASSPKEYAIARELQSMRRQLMYEKRRAEDFKAELTPLKNASTTSISESNVTRLKSKISKLERTAKAERDKRERAEAALEKMRYQSDISRNQIDNNRDGKSEVAVANFPKQQSFVEDNSNDASMIHIQETVNALRHELQYSKLTIQQLQHERDDILELCAKSVEEISSLRDTVADQALTIDNLNEDLCSASRVLAGKLTQSDRELEIQTEYLIRDANLRASVAERKVSILVSRCRRAGIDDNVFL